MLKRLLTHWLVLTLALYVAGHVCLYYPKIGLTMTEPFDPLKLFAGSAALGIVNALLSPLLRTIACLLNCLTLGLANLLINVMLFWAVGTLNLGFKVETFWGALAGSIIVGIVNGILSPILAPRRKKD